MKVWKTLILVVGIRLANTGLISVLFNKWMFCDLMFVQEPKRISGHWTGLSTFDKDDIILETMQDEKTVLSILQLGYVWTSTMQPMMCLSGFDSAVEMNVIFNTDGGVSGKQPIRVCPSAPNLIISHARKTRTHHTPTTPTYLYLAVSQ